MIQLHIVRSCSYYKHTRFKILKKAFLKSKISEDKDFLKFTKENKFWLDDYALFMALKENFKGKSFIYWPDEIRKHSKSAIKLHFATKCVFIFNMIVGRLELVPFLIFLHPDSWKIRK